MDAPLLNTKLYIPARRSGLVPRPHLLARLDEAQRAARLMLLSAPAGFGKTTILSEWVASSKRPVAWVSLDEGDNDPARSPTEEHREDGDAGRPVAVEHDLCLGVVAVQVPALPLVVQKAVAVAELDFSANAEHGLWKKGLGIRD